jgi:two-component system sensor histidine kinase KdpD
MAAADWRFVPLETDLGVLALIGIARDDGGDPVPPNRAVLLATLASLAALAHERLRLEDLTLERAVHAKDRPSQAARPSR